jgi:hypothetical protein
MANLPHITRFGLPGIDRVPFGMHACHSYSNRDQLVVAVAPYSVAGRCVQIAASVHASGPDAAMYRAFAPRPLHRISSSRGPFSPVKLVRRIGMGYARGEGRQCFTWSK